MQKLKLSYFDFNGGRGECVRMALALGNIPFEDDRITMERWPQIKAEQPYGALPVLYVDGVPLAQTNAICRYVGKLADLYPTDPLQAAFCDEVLDTLEELNQQLGATMGLLPEEKKTKRQHLANQTLPIYLKGLNRRLLAGGGQYFANQKLTVADLRACDVIQWLSSGMLDDIPTQLTQTVAPQLMEHCERIQREPRVVGYLAKRKKI